MAQETVRTSAEIVDAFAITYLLLPTLFPDYVSWCSRVLERYDMHVDTSEETFHRAKLLSRSTNSLELVIARTRDLEMLHLLCPLLHLLDEHSMLLKIWLDFFASKRLSPKWM